MRRLAAAAAVVVGSVVLSGCGPTMSDLPLPGSGVHGDTIEVKVQFDEALNLARGAQVRINGVSSGKVRSVSAKDFKAIAVLDVRRSAQMRATASARLRYTTPLGELFVDVTNPDQGPLLHDGATLAVDRSSTAPTVEDALASASLLVNGGGLNQLQTVTEELNTAFGGREDTVRQLMQRADTFLGEANATTADVDRALTALATVSQVLRANRATIDAAMTDIRPAARVLRRNTPGLTRLLAKLDEFSSTANGVVGATRAQILQMLQQVSPVLDEFLANRDTLRPSLDALVSLSDNLNAAIPGDYANMKLEMQLDKVTLPTLLGAPGSVADPGTGTTGGGSGGLGGLLGGLFGGTSTTKTSTSPSAATTTSPLTGLLDLLGGGK
ncbi:MCE family protein [Nocardioides pocheonensis]|uniref:MCE family protein n=1 Tax=Nocardioides pocheonensis TaxID=661485 RepID=UPI0016072683|nr:MCE family protein [Nocardioides pocheonensis]